MKTPKLHSHPRMEDKLKVPKDHVIVDRDVFESISASEATMWAWWSTDGETFCHVYPQRRCVEMCSPDGFKQAMARGDGEIVEVVVLRKNATLKGNRPGKGV
jgi:hypothetical protein